MNFFICNYLWINFFVQIILRLWLLVLVRFYKLIISVLQPVEFPSDMYLRGIPSSRFSEPPEFSLQPFRNSTSIAYIPPSEPSYELLSPVVHSKSDCCINRYSIITEQFFGFIWTFLVYCVRFDICHRVFLYLSFKPATVWWCVAWWLHFIFIFVKRRTLFLFRCSFFDCLSFLYAECRQYLINNTFI